MPSLRALLLCHSAIAASALAGDAAVPAPACADEEGACTADDSLLQTRSGGSKPQPASKSVLDYVKLLTKGRNGEANPRITCTSGNLLARQRIVWELKRLGVKPFGIPARGRFQQALPGTRGQQDCEPGIANVIGLVEGTERPNEYLLLSAHYNGPNNQNRVWTEVGNEDTDDSYDDAGGAAATLAVAARLMASKPKTSVIIFLSDGEEGWQNVGVQMQGTDPANPQAYNTSEGVKKLCETVSQMLGRECWAAPGIPNNFAIGMAYFAQNFPLADIKLALALDPLGAPGLRGSDFMAVLPYDRTEGLRGLFTQTIPQGDGFAHPIYFPAPVVEQSGSYSDLTFLLDNNTMRQVPRVWIAQLGFQVYHGGLQFGLVNQSLNGVIPDLDESAYWTLDRKCVLDGAALVIATDTIGEMVAKMADQDLGKLRYKPFVTVGPQDFLDANDTYTFLKAALQKGTRTTGIPANLTQTFIQVIDASLLQLSKCLAGQLQFCLAPLQNAVGLAIGLDFFSKRLGGIENFAEEPNTPIPCPKKPKALGQTGSRWDGFHSWLCDAVKQVHH